MVLLTAYNDTAQASGSVTVGDGVWKAQSFVVTRDASLTSVKLRLYQAVAPGTVTCSIRANDVNKPTGADLASGTYDGSLITTDSGGEWVTFTMGLGLTADTKYWIVLRAANASSIEWLADGFDPTYSSGGHNFSNNAGADWDTESSTQDDLFEVYGTTSESSGTAAGGIGSAGSKWIRTDYPVGGEPEVSSLVEVPL